HAEGSEEAMREKRPEWLAAHALDHASKDEEVGVAVRPARPRLEIERARGVFGDDTVGTPRLEHLPIHEIERIVVAVSGDMLAELQQRHVIGPSEVRHVLRDWILER